MARIESMTSATRLAVPGRTLFRRLLVMPREDRADPLEAVGGMIHSRCERLVI